MEANQGDKETASKSIDKVTITQEPVANEKQFHPREVVTPLIDNACGRRSGPDEGCCSKNMFLLLELQKWKQ